MARDRDSARRYSARRPAARARRCWRPDARRYERRCGRSRAWIEISLLLSHHPGRIEDVQQHHGGERPWGAPAERAKTRRPAPVITAAETHERQLEPPPPRIKPESDPEVRRRAGPQREIVRMHEPVENEVREHGEA